MRLIDADEWIKELEVPLDDEEAPGELKDYNMGLISEITSRPTVNPQKKIIEKLNNRISYLDRRNKICTYTGDFKNADRYADRMSELIKSRELVESGCVDE